MDTRLLGVRVTLLLWGCIRPCQALTDPWAQCPSKVCKEKFADGSCESWCAIPECLMDGFDCLAEERPCEDSYTNYCRDHYANSHCEQGCNRAPCGWDGSDCFLSQAPIWAKGTLLIHTKILPQDIPVQNRSLLWALSTILQSTVKLRGVVPFDLSQQLFSLQPHDLRDLLTQKSTYKANGSLLFLQVDNRPCSSAASTCFPFATQAGNFLRTAKEKSKLLTSSLQEMQNVYEVRGVGEELGDRENYQTSKSWLWPVVGVTVGLLLALVLLVAMAIRRMRRRAQEREGGGRVQHVSTVTETNHTAQPWTLHTPHRGERMKKKEKEKNGKKKKKKAKDSGKRRSEPLGEDAIRLRPLRKELDIGSDTDITQSSMEDISSIRDHRPQEQKHFRVAASQLQSPNQGRSALHWACSVNNLSLARTLVRYGALVDLQDYKGETALFLSAIYGCYDTARFLLLHGANPHLPDRRGRRPLDVAREGFHQQVLELLLAQRPQKAPTLMNPSNDVQWNDPAFSYDQWLPAPGLPGRSASFSGVIGHRETPPPHPSDWSTGRGRCISPQHWHPQLNQSATALVSPRILSRPSRPISTLQEVTSEAEEEDRERPGESARATTPHPTSPQPAPRQRSFSCTQHALQRRSAINQVESPMASVPVKAASEQVDRMMSVPPAPAGKAPSHSEAKPADLPAKAQLDSEMRSGRNWVQKAEIETANYSTANFETSTQTVL